MTANVRAFYGAALTTRPVVGETWRRCWIEASRPYLGTSGDVGNLLASHGEMDDGSLVVLVDSNPHAGADVAALRAAGAIVLLLAPTAMSRSDRAALRAGVDGLITMGDSIDAFRVAVAMLTDGEAYASSTAARLLFDEHRQRPQGPPVALDVVLSGRERAVLQALVDGLTTKAAARRLGISVKTVEAHRSRLYARLGVSSQSEAVTRALTDGRLLTAGPPGSGRS